MRGYQRLLAVLFAMGMAGSPARATSVYQYARGEDVVIDNGMAPNGHFALASHGTGEFGSENFNIYLLAEPAHRRIAILDGITHNLDSGPTAFHAEWAPDSRHVAIAYRIERHVNVIALYRIERGRAVAIGGPTLFSDDTSRDVNDTDHENNSFTHVSWLSPKRFVLKENHLFIDAPASLLPALGRFGKQENEQVYQKRIFFKFSAEATCELTSGNRYRIVDIKPGAFED